MHNIKSFRWLFFIMCLTMFWMFAPLLILSRIIGPVGPIGLLIALASVWYLAPRANAWLVHNSETFRVIWEWARENEETP